MRNYRQMTRGILAARTLLSVWLVIDAASTQAKSEVVPAVTEKPVAIESIIREYDALPKTSPAAQYDRFISQHRAIISASTPPYGSALMWSLEFERSEAAMALLRAGAAVPEGAVSLAARGGMDDLIPLLIAHGVKGTDRDRAILEAAKYGHESTLRLLLNMGADVDTASVQDGFTALHVALMDRRIGAIRILLSAGAKLEATDHKGRTPLHWGPFAYRMLEKHIYQKLQQPHDTVPVDPGEAVGITLLLDAGANMEARDEEGNTPLHHAAMIGSFRAAEVLMARGANPNAKNRAGQTPKAIAKAKGNKALIEIVGRKPSAPGKSEK